MRYTKFGLVGTYPDGEIESVRGWSKNGEERYEIDQADDGRWRCLRVVSNYSDDGWGFIEIPCNGDLFSCMVAAEKDAKERDLVGYDDDHE